MAITYNATAPTFNLKEIGSEDIKNGIEAQAASETLRRKKALADAFSKSIVTEPVVADSDKYDSNGNKVQSKGQILTSPGDVDQQKFFKHVSDAGLGFDEAKAVYDHYQMQKDSALHALKTGMEIDTLGGGSGVPTRANAPIITASPAPAPVIPTQAPVSVPTEAPAVVKTEVTNETDFDKINRLTQWMNSKKKSLVEKAQTELGTKVDGIIGKNTRNALDQLKARMIEANLKKDTTEGAQNRVDVIAGAGAQSKGPEGKLTIDDAFDSTPAKIGSVVDNRTALQRIEDRGASSNFGRGTETQGYKAGDVKVRDISGFPKYIQDNLKQQGLSPDKMQSALDLRLASIPAPSIINEKGEIDALGYRQRQAIYQAKLKEAEDGFYKDIATGNAAAVARDLAQQGNQRAIQERSEAHRVAEQSQTPTKGLESYGIKGLNPEESAKISNGALAQFQLGQSIKKSTSELLKKSGNMSPDELSNAVKQPLMMMAQIEGAGNEKQEEGLMAGLRQDKGLAAILDQNKGKSAKEQIAVLSISKLTSQQQSKFLKLLDDYAADIVKNGKARNELETKAKITGGKFDPTGGEGSGAKAGLSKGLKGKSTKGREL